MQTSTERHDDRIITTIEISPREVEVRETPFGVVVQVPGLSSSGQPGAPALPRTLARFGFPRARGRPSSRSRRASG